MIRRCSLLMAAILLSGCGNFLGNLGEELNDGNRVKKQKQVQSVTQQLSLNRAAGPS